MAKIDIKGWNQSLVFVFSNGDADEYLSILQERLASNPQLFFGSAVLFQGEGLNSLSQEEIAAIQRLCLDYGMIMNNGFLPAGRVKSHHKDLSVYRTLRSGQKVHSEVSVIVWGDVHESAEISAARDVLVLGKLEGIAHAGCYGDLNSTIFALVLSPRQLRIGDRISRPPGDFEQSSYPELAYVEGDNICIKEYSAR